MKTPTPSLQELVSRHAIRYEVWTRDEIVRGQKLTTGFDVELHGTHAGARTRLSPGCRQCVETYRALREVAAWAIPPPDDDGAWVEVGPFDNSLHVSPQQGPVVVLTVQIRQRSGTEHPIEGCERRCLQKMRGSLAKLGVRNGQ